MSDHINILLSDEIRRLSHQREGDDSDNDKYIIFDRRDVTIDSEFHLIDEDENGNVIQMPIKGEGFLDSFVAIAPSESFNIRVEIDEYDAVDDAFGDIKSISRELSHIGAYDKGTDNVISVTDYPFQERLDVVIEPSSEITFSVIRAEVRMGGGDMTDGIEPELTELVGGQP